MTEIPWARFMKTALGAIRLTRDEFWSMSMCEFFSACDGYAEANGCKPDPKTTGPGTSEMIQNTEWKG